MTHHFKIPSIVAVLGLIAVGCSTAPSSSADRTELVEDATATLKQAKETDPTLGGFLQSSSGFVVFPHVAKGAAGVGGSYGRGTVYAGKELIGYADITQATVGLQIGAEQFYEIVVFESQADLDRFKAGKLSLAANLSAVGLKTGVAESAKYSDGVVVFIKPVAGLMVEAALGGQQFTYQPK